MIINQEAAYLTYTSESWLGTASDPLIRGMDEGPFKLLVVPNDWSTENVKLRFAVENNWNYRARTSFNINSEPNLHGFQINNYTDTGYGYLNESHFAYGLTHTYNHTEVAFADSSADESYFAVECTGKAYAWTQLVVSMYNVSNYELYLLQDLPWINPSGPASENVLLRSSVSTNSTYEFGVQSSRFILLFEIQDAGELITFKIDINQYETQRLSITSPQIIIPLNVGLIILIVGISIGVVAAVGVGYYFLRKRGGIRTKSPG
jgi:hypothetical protein